MPESGTVASASEVGTSQYNNLRNDALDITLGHPHTGAANAGMLLNLSGTDASKPAASSDNTGFTYYATDTEILYRSNGTSWVAIGFQSPFTTQGDVLFRGASVADRLGIGSADYFLQTQGEGADPIWAAL